MEIDPTVSYRTFGFIPTGDATTDRWRRWFGYPNLIKRLQARDLMQALDLKPHEVVLDFGCGEGYVTVEMAKQAREAWGIDVTPNLAMLKIPVPLQSKLKYLTVDGQRLPFAAHHFDVVLASEVLPMVADPSVFLREIKRVLKPAGRLVILNGLGHPSIRDAFEKRPWIFRWLAQRHHERFPSSYEEYCEILQKSFGTNQTRFFTASDINRLLVDSGFRVVRESCSPGHLAGLYFSWSQFYLYLTTGRTLSQRRFIPNYLLFSFLRMFEQKSHPGGLLWVAVHA